MNEFIRWWKDRPEWVDALLIMVIVGAMAIDWERLT